MRGIKPKTTIGGFVDDTERAPSLKITGSCCGVIGVILGPGEVLWANLFSHKQVNNYSGALGVC